MVIGNSKYGKKNNVKRRNIQKKVGDVMGGHVIDLPEFKIYDNGKADVRAEGRAEGKAETADEVLKAIDGGATIEDIQRMLTKEK